MDRLPPELLEHILDMAVEPAPPVGVSRQRVRLLRSCCLVSCLWRDVAQPKLWDAVLVGKQPSVLPPLNTIRFESLEQAPAELAAKTRLLRALGHGADFAALERAVERMTNLEVAVFQGWMGANTLRLTSLSLESFPIDPRSFPTFPHLVSLSLIRCSIPFQSCPLLLSTSLMPALRALLLSDNIESSGDKLYHRFGAGLLQQLEVLQVDICRTIHNELLELEYMDKVLVTTDYLKTTQLYTEATSPLVRNLCPIHIAARTYPPETYAHALSCVVGALTSKSSFLKRLILPCRFHPFLSFPRTVERDALLALCAERGIEVFWSGSAEATQPVLNGDFWEEMKRERREREAQ
ncbi:hypothetical protein JCM10213_002264 [Rhodosporidiobolus nylandii]